MNSTPTIDDLKKIYYSDLYQQMLADYDKVASHKLDNRDQGVSINMLSQRERDFKFIGLTTEQVIDHFEKVRRELIEYTFACIDLFVPQPEDDGEFPEGEELGEENASETVEVFGIARDIFLDKFCEFYVLETMSRDQLLQYLSIKRMPGAKKYAGQITKLYKQLA